MDEVRKFIADKAFIRYGVNPKKTITAGMAIMSTLCKYRIIIVVFSFRQESAMDLFCCFKYLDTFAFSWLLLFEVAVFVNIKKP